MAQSCLRHSPGNGRVLAPDTLRVLQVSEDYIINAALVHAALTTDTTEFHEDAASFIWDWICAADIQYTPFGRAYVPQSPLLGNTVLAAALAQLYAIRAPRSGVRRPRPRLRAGCLSAI